MRNFSGFDEVTTHNLAVLERQARVPPSGNHETLQALLVHILGVVDMLPPMVGALIPTGHCAIGNVHWGKPDPWCHTQWAHITADLATGLDRVEAARERLLAEPDLLAERKTSIGEKVAAACKRFRTEGHDPAIARDIQRMAAGSEMAGDARSLERLMSKKRISDVSAHDREVMLLIAHIEIIARRYHHR